MRQTLVAVFIGSGFNDAISMALYPCAYARDAYLFGWDVLRRSHPLGMAFGKELK